MHFSVTIKSKEVVSKVNFAIFTVNKNIFKNRVATYQERSVCSNDTIIYIYQVIFCSCSLNIKYIKKINLRFLKLI